MSIIFHANLPSTLIEIPKKRWHKAFATIYCSRALFSHFKEYSLTKNRIRNNSNFSHVPYSRVVIDVFDRSQVPFFSNIEQSSLAQLIKEKNKSHLVNYGGVEGIASSLKTNVEHGIQGDSEDVLHRNEAFGTNTYPKPPTKNFFHFVFEAFKDRAIIILLLSAALSLGFGIKENGPREGWYDGGSVVLAIFLVISVSAISNFRQNRQFNKLSKISNNIAVEVMRNGRRQQISIFEIVVGDVVFLKIGDQVPTDGLFIDGHSLQVDESSMTGESDHVEINRTQNPFLISGTKVVNGYAKMLVTSVGMNTTWGQMMSTINHHTDDHQTPLQARLNKLTSSIQKFGLMVAFLVLIALFIRYFMGNTKDKKGNTEFNGGTTKFDDVINVVVRITAVAVTIVVVMIPKGLPLAYTLTLAYSMKRMTADKAMVRNLSTCETIGSATIICTDKTGTLTLNEMKVTKFWLGQESVEQRGSNPIDPNVLDLIHQGVGLNTTGGVYKNISGSNYEFSGSPTEKALLSWVVLELDMDIENLKHKFTILQVEAFNSEKKRSGVLLKKNENNKIYVHWKGAAEMILAMCSNYYVCYGNMNDLDDERLRFNQIIESMAANSLRCIAFAHKQTTKEHNMVEDYSFTLLGLVGIKDPCRLGVKKAVQDCHVAGVKVKMVTGDNVFTARAIATECGILRPNQENDEVIEGEEFRNLTPEERFQRVDKISVMARSSPFDKLLMVQILKDKGHVVAVTGDGTNDAPALKEADIGLSMGIQGTEVAKQSSDIVILDDNFASVVTVLRWGRCVYNNIQKFIQFQLTMNVSAIAINFVAAVLSREVPLTTVQILWVNLIMNTLGALALATEQPTNELMVHPPVRRSEPLITNIMWRNLLAQALYQIIILLTLQFNGESIFRVSSKVNDTLIFNIFVLCQVFNEFNARRLEKGNVFEGLHRNRLFMGTIGITLSLQLVMVEFLKKFAGTERLNWGQWGACIGIAAVSWPIGWLVKFVPIPEKPIFSYVEWLQKLKALVRRCIPYISFIVECLPS